MKLASPLIIVNAKKHCVYYNASGRMRTDAQRNYAASQRTSGAGNELKRKRFVRFLYIVYK